MVHRLTAQLSTASWRIIFKRYCIVFLLCHWAYGSNILIKKIRHKSETLIQKQNEGEKKKKQEKGIKEIITLLFKRYQYRIKLENLT
jgi:hypothetical protein